MAPHTMHIQVPADVLLGIVGKVTQKQWLDRASESREPKQHSGGMMLRKQ